MFYIVEQTIKGRTYLYRVEAYWDKEKKQSRQKRTYIGPKNKKYKKSIKSFPSMIIHKNYGNIFLLNWIAEKIGLTGIFEKYYPGHYRERLALTFYEPASRNLHNKNMSNMRVP